MSSGGHLGGNPKGRPIVLAGRLNPADCHLLFFSFFFLLYSIFFNSFLLVLLCTVVCQQRVKAVGTQGKAQQHLDLCYSHFHGSSSTRENSAVLPFLPIDTCKQLLRTSNFGAKAPAFSNLSAADWSREAIVFRPDIFGRRSECVDLQQWYEQKTAHVDMLRQYCFTSQGFLTNVIGNRGTLGYCPYLVMYFVGFSAQPRCSIEYKQKMQLCMEVASYKQRSAIYSTRRKPVSHSFVSYNTDGKGSYGKGQMDISWRFALLSMQHVKTAVFLCTTRSKNWSEFL